MKRGKHCWQIMVSGASVRSALNKYSHLTFGLAAPIWVFSIWMGDKSKCWYSGGFYWFCFKGRVIVALSQQEISKTWGMIGTGSELGLGDDRTSRDGIKLS